MRVAAYIRVSTLDQAREGYSLAAQHGSLKRWASDHGHTIVDIYEDPGISGKDIAHRPAMVRLLDDVQKDKFDILVVWALSRLTRSVADLYDIWDHLNNHSVSLISYTEGFDTTKPMGRAMMGILGVFAQMEREITAERVIAATMERAAQGKRTCSEVLGYDRDGKDSLKINEKEAEYVRFAYLTYLRTHNLSYTAEMAALRGYRGKRGKAPAPWSVRIMLTRPIYCGYNSLHGYLYPGQHEPIIDVQTYDRVQRLLAKDGRYKTSTPLTIRQRLQQQAREVGKYL